MELLFVVMIGNAGFTNGSAGLSTATTTIQLIREKLVSVGIDVHSSTLEAFEPSASTPEF
jgi:hypothetical protein